MRYPLAIFDFDGVLADSLPWFSSVLNEVADRFGFRRVAEHEADELRRCDARQILARLDVPLWKVPAIASHMRRMKAEAAASIPLFEDASRLLADLRARGVMVAVVSSDSELSIRRTLGPHADVVFRYDCSSSLFGKAPKIRRTVKAAGLSPSQALYVGDEIRDGEAAAKAGVAFGAVGWGFTHPEALKRCSPTHLFQSMDEIVQAAVG